MKKVLVFFLLGCSFLVSYPLGANDYIKEYEITNHPTLNFDKPSEGYSITLKGTKCTHYTLINSKNVSISYIVKINTPVAAAGVVHLSLQDRDGFEITRRALDGVSIGYSGSLKGNIVVKAEEYQRISGAELFFTIHSK